MQQTFNPTNPAAGATATTIRGLQFQAQGVLVTSGQNFVTVLPDQYVIPPGVIGLFYPFRTAQVQAQFQVTAPPTGTAPIGPVLQTTSSLVYTDEQQAFNPGTVGTPQTVAVQSGAVGAGTASTIQVGLARALTAFMWTQNGQAEGSWSVTGFETALSPVRSFVVATGGNETAFGFAMGVIGGPPVAASPVDIRYLSHLWPRVDINSTDHAYFYSARLYF